MRQLPPSIMEKINKQNQTIYENANPKMNVAIARPKSTVMDSSYWTVETIRTGTNLGDVSLAPRRFKVTGRPNRIYEIHVQNGIVGTAIREYPDKLKDGWQNQFTLGSGSNVAIAFNGHWERYRKLWRLVTDEKPHILWVDGDGKLQTQLWDDATSKQELATNVKYVRALRGWKNVNFIDKDQGIIAGYIKTDGTVWYRNYCSQLDGTSIWENERQLVEFTGVAVSLNLFITNDYRMGFIIEDNLGKIYWYITERNWAGMAIAPDNFSVAPYDVSATLIDIEYPVMYAPDENISVAPFEIIGDLRYAKTDNKFITIHNEMVIVKDENNMDVEDWGKRLIVRTQNELYNVFAGDFEILDKNNTPYYPDIVAEIEDSLYQLDFNGLNNFNNVDKKGTLKFRGTATINGVGDLYLPFEMEFTPINLVPTAVPLPVIEVIYNE